MKEAFLFLLAIGVLIIGAFLGYFYRLQRTTTIDVSLDASKTYTILRDLRSGDTNAVFETLEKDLDVNVISLRAILDERPQMEHAKNYTNLLRRIAEYRSVHTRHNQDSNLDQMVTAALNSVSRTNN
ncbi:MAG TPA: hypothetical protein VKY92_20400 [Verrucomicrobiae bacterium]|jgi:hypothetical protein|nr:hypothetical protein [Verrucomicrobiae bacterium]